MRVTLTFLALVFAFAIFSTEAKAQNVSLVSALGGKCMDAEGGTRRGARLIGYGCNNGSNQIYWFNQNGSITQGNLCLDAKGGAGRDGDEVVLWDCNGQANQRWSMQADGTIRGINGKCLDLKGGGSPQFWVMNQPVILWSCHGGENQRWGKGYKVRRNQLGNLGNQFILSGQRRSVRVVEATDQQERLIAAGGQNLLDMIRNLIAAGGQNLIGVDAGTLIGVDAGTLLVVVK